MTNRVLEVITRSFTEGQQQSVIDILSSIELKHVMADSEYNLENTLLAIVKLSQGDLQQVIYFTKRAKVDFRDVIMWSSQEK